MWGHIDVNDRLDKNRDVTQDVAHKFIQRSDGGSKSGGIWVSALDCDSVRRQGVVVVSTKAVTDKDSKCWEHSRLTLVPF
jgi:hypothetical protein